MPFNLSFAIAVDGPVDTALMESALNGVISRHAGLRAALVPSESLSETDRRARLLQLFASGIVAPGMHCQSVVTPESCRVGIERFDISRDFNQKPRIVETLSKALDQPFDRSHPPFIRAFLFTLSSLDHLLGIVLDHLVCDHWALNVLIREVAEIYNAALCNRSARLPSLDTHYPDFAREQWLRAQNGGFLDDVLYWNNQWMTLESNQLRCAYLPEEYRRLESSSGGVFQERVAVEPNLFASMRAFCSATRITSYMLFLSAILIYFHRLTGRNTLAVWTSLSNRISMSQIGIIGWFANCHLVGVSFATGDTLLDVITKVRMAVTNALVHQQAPHALVVAYRNRRLITYEDTIVCDLLRGVSPLTGADEDNRVRFRRDILPDEVSVTNRTSGLHLAMGAGSASAALVITYNGMQFSRVAVARVLREIMLSIRQCITDANQMVRRLEQM